MVVVLAGLFMGCPTLLSPSICYVMLCYIYIYTHAYIWQTHIHMTSTTSHTLNPRVTPNPLD